MYSRHVIVLTVTISLLPLLNFILTLNSISMNSPLKPVQLYVVSV